MVARLKFATMTVTSNVGNSSHSCFAELHTQIHKTNIPRYEISRLETTLVGDGSALSDRLRGRRDKHEMHSMGRLCTCIMCIHIYVHTYTKVYIYI